MKLLPFVSYPPSIPGDSCVEPEDLGGEQGAVGVAVSPWGQCMDREGLRSLCAHPVPGTGRSPMRVVSTSCHACSLRLGVTPISQAGKPAQRRCPLSQAAWQVSGGVKSGGWTCLTWEPGVISRPLWAGWALGRWWPVAREQEDRHRVGHH